jgi:hypothetical protein
VENLDRWIDAYIAMDDEARNDHLIFAESSARAHPSKKQPPLSLAASGGGAPFGPQPLNKSQNLTPLALVKGVVKVK